MKVVEVKAKSSFIPLSKLPLLLALNKSSTFCKNLAPWKMSDETHGLLSGFMFESFRLFSLPVDTLYSINNEYGSREICSQGELEATEYLRCKEPKSWQTFYSGEAGQKKIFSNDGKRKLIAIPDAFHQQKNICFFYNG